MASTEQLLNTAARWFRIPFRTFLRPRDFVPPKKALILKPCCMREVILTTPLLYQLRQTYPQAQIDWAVSDWARSAVATNRQVNELLSSGQVGLPGCSWGELNAFAEFLREQEYDTCFVPDESAALSYVAWRAGIPQRVGLDVRRQGFAHTLTVCPEPNENLALSYLRLAEVLGIETNGSRSQFEVSLDARTQVTELLVEEMEWFHDRPLVILHPGGGASPTGSDERIRWPVERFARLGNLLVRDHDALIVVVGGAADVHVANAVAGLMSAKVFNMAGKLSLAAMGALCEVAHLYVGNNAGPSYIAAAVSCPTLVIYGPEPPERVRPFANNDHLLLLWEAYSGEFDWTKGVSFESAKYEAVRLLRGGRSG